MKTVIISLGGSLIYPKKLDLNFLKSFKKLVYSHEGRFVLYCGGGALARKWQKIGRRFGLRGYLLDWLGIFATRKNAKIVKDFLKDNVHDKIITNPTVKINFKEKVLVAAGWKPGWSTDYDAVLIAKNLGANVLVNMSNIDYAYDKDPKKYKNAKPIKKTTWKRFRKIVGSEWKPGLNMPFDPIASKLAEKVKLKVVIIGNDLKNLKNLLENKKIKGTIVE
jgi:uridylate kinase